jgi:hypothetical protein
MSAGCRRPPPGLWDATTVPRPFLLLPARRMIQSRNAEPCRKGVAELCGPRDEDPAMITSASSASKQAIWHVARSTDNSRCLWPGTTRTDHPQFALLCSARTLLIAATRRRSRSIRRTVHCVIDALSHRSPHGNVPAGHGPGSCIIGGPRAGGAIFG